MQSKLHRNIVHAYTTVPMYCNRLDGAVSDFTDITWEDFKRLPVMRKEDFRKDVSRCISSNYIIDYMSGRLGKMSTSGTSGVVMDIYKTHDDYRKSMAELWLRRSRYYGIKTEDRMCYFYTAAPGVDSEHRGVRYVEIKNMLGFSKRNINEESMEVIYEMMNDFQPVWMTIQPGMMVLLLDYIKKNHNEVIKSLKYIEFTGEMVTRALKEEVKNLLGCCVADQYGCHEMNSIAYECPQGNMHVMESNVHVEILENDCIVEDGKEGEICVTSLNNDVMPFVRYMIGDRGYISNDLHCKCGNKSPVLKITEGRSNTMIKREDGTWINKYVLYEPIEIMNDMVNLIVQFQITQKDYNYFEIQMVLDDEVMEDAYLTQEDVVNKYMELMKENGLRDCEFEFRFVDFIMSGENNKVEWFVGME